MCMSPGREQGHGPSRQLHAAAGRFWITKRCVPDEYMCYGQSEPEDRDDP